MKQLKIGIVIGATNEQGYQAIIHTINEPLFLELCTPILFGSTEAAVKAKDMMVSSDEDFQFAPPNYIKDPKDALDGRINIITGHEDRKDSMEATVKAYMNNYIDAIVIVPQDKAAGFDYKAAIEDSTKVIEADEKDVLTWRINGNVRALNINGTCDIPMIVKALRKNFLFIKPHIAIMAKDEISQEEMIELRKQGYVVFGPFDANKVIAEGTYKPYDCLVFLNNENAVNKLFSSFDQTYTYYHLSGLPMVMTASFDNNNPTNIMQSIYAAIDIYRNRRKYRSATKSPLEKQWVPRGRDDFKLDLSKETDDNNQ